MVKLIRLASFVLLVTCAVTVLSIYSGCSKKTASSTFLELFNLAPTSAADYGDQEGIIVIDYASIYEDAGITFSTREELFDNIVKDRFVVSLMAGSDITGFGRYMLQSTILKKYVGYDVTDVDAEIQFGFPPANAVAAIGRFSPEATADALTHQEEWPPDIKSRYATEEYHGVTIHNWGDGFRMDLKTVLSPPHVDNLGRARPLAVTDRYLFFSASMDTTKQMIDASRNDDSSLADLPEYAAIAEGLTELDAYTAAVGDASLANLPLTNPELITLQMTEEQKELLEKHEGPLLKNFLTFGSGVGKDEKGIYTAIVLYHENSADARENVSLLKERIESAKSLFSLEPWSEKITGTDIKADGNTLLAKLYTPSQTLWQSWILTHDNLLIHEG